MPTKLKNDGNSFRFDITEENKNKKIWRYMSLTKFISTLNDQSMFFSNTKTFEDHFEGALSNSDIDLLSQLKPEFKNLKNCVVKSNNDDFVNCWHINENESMAFWKIYSENQKGIAIQSTYKRLHNCFLENFYKIDRKNDAHTCHIFLGEVDYIDHKKESAMSLESQAMNALIPIIRKKKCFEYEKELRAVLVFDPTNKAPIKLCGISIPIDTSILIKKIVISPFYSGWEQAIIIDIIRKYCSNITVEKSLLLTHL